MHVTGLPRITHRADAPRLFITLNATKTFLSALNKIYAQQRIPAVMGRHSSVTDNLQTSGRQLCQALMTKQMPPLPSLVVDKNIGTPLG